MNGWLEVSCRYCGARVGEGCKFRDGVNAGKPARETHGYRVITYRDREERKKVDRHIDLACRVAGLPVMTEIYGVILDRGEISLRYFADLEAADVEAAYWAHIGPAIDDMEERAMTGEL